MTSRLPTTSATMRFLAIKNFERFQHYKDRNPPWIKLYTALLDDPAFLALPEAAQAQLLKLWLLAARMGHPLPNNPKLLAGKVGASRTFHLDVLIEAGFITPCNEIASTTEGDSASGSGDKSRAKRKRPGSTLVRERGQRQREKELSAGGAPAVAAAEAAAPKSKRATWITPFADAWELLYGGAMSIEPNLKPLKTVVEKLGAEEALRRWEIYLGQTGAKYASAARFSSTLNEWEAPKAGQENAGVVVAPETLARAAALFGLGRDHALFAFDGNKATYGAAKAKAAADVRAGVTFDEDLKTSELWKGGLGAMPDALAIKEIARRLEKAKNGNGNGNHANAGNAAAVARAS